MNTTRKKSRILTCLLIILILGMMSVMADAATKLDDKDITRAIENDLEWNDAVQSHLIDVETHNGIVELRGSVDNILAKELATKIAEMIKGVRAVVNELQVKPVVRSDRELQTDVDLALKEDPATDSWKVDAKVNDGVVTLSGTFESYAQKILCTDVVEDVKGVKAVNNNITIKYKSKRPDNEIKAEIKDRLKYDVWIDSYMVYVDVTDGKVKLTGTVGSAAEKSQARSDAWVAGVHSVDDSGLKVAWWARESAKREKLYESRTDTKIEKAVKDAMLWDPRVWSFEVNVDSDYGSVTLTGVVDNYKAMQAAEQDAKDTLGVWQVRNHMKVRPVKSVSDDDLVKNVKAALDRNPYTDRYDLSVAVINGKVYLYGVVNSEFDKSEASDVAFRVNGVVDVANYLRVHETWPMKSDLKIKQDIKDDLLWDPYIDSSRITIGVLDGIASLTGNVDTWFEYTRAAEEAVEAGATNVKNYLRVKESPPPFME